MAFDRPTLRELITQMNAEIAEEKANLKEGTDYGALKIFENSQLALLTFYMNYAKIHIEFNCLRGAII